VLPPLFPPPPPQENSNLIMGHPLILSISLLNSISSISLHIIPIPYLFHTILSCPHPSSLSLTSSPSHSSTPFPSLIPIPSLHDIPMMIPIPYPIPPPLIPSLIPFISSHSQLNTNQILIHLDNIYVTNK